MPTLKVVNIKCGGCENQIKSALEKEEIGNIKIDVAGGTVSFDGDIEEAKKILSSLGYPEEGSEEAKKFSKKAKSYISCMTGRINGTKNNNKNKNF